MFDEKMGEVMTQIINQRLTSCSCNRGMPSTAESSASTLQGLKKDCGAVLTMPGTFFSDPTQYSREA
ncbi:MAG: hypothetical protein HXX11_05810 [Desulfuromonadales bacterium]|nr:hypothetical protein [Desulfuromonadales bacterium]